MGQIVKHFEAWCVWYIKPVDVGPSVENEPACCATSVSYRHKMLYWFGSVFLLLLLFSYLLDQVFHPFLISSKQICDNRILALNYLRTTVYFSNISLCGESGTVFATLNFLRK